MQSAAKPLIRALKGERLSPPPIWLMRQAGRYLPEYRKVRQSVSGFLELCYTPELAAEVTLQPIRRYGFDAAIIFSDILVIPHALGQKVAFEEGVGPVLEPVEDASALRAATALEVVDHLAPVYDAIGRVGRELPDPVALIGFAGAPWTVATYMVEGGTTRTFDRIKRLAFGETDRFQLLIDTLVDATAAHLIKQIEAGAEAVQIFDTWSGVLPERAFQRWCVAPVAEISRRVKEAHPDVPVIGFPRGSGPNYAGFAAAARVDAVTIDYSVPLEWAKSQVQPGACVQGNLDPIHLVAGGAGMEEEVRRILEILGDGPFVFNLGHGIVPSTPPENVARLVEIVRQAGEKG